MDKKLSESEESDETDEESPRKLILNDERRCKYCVKLLKNVSEVVKHETKCEAALTNTAEIVATKDGKKRFLCNTCFRTFKFLTGLSKHKLRHESPGGFICRFCDARYCSDFELQKHKELSHMAYKCQICKGKFNNTKSYEEHIINVHDGRDRIYEICEDCGAQFKTRSILSFHKQSMCGTSKPFKCDQCGSYFRNQWSLKNHLLIHKGEKKFCCSFCGYSCINRGQLVVHERKHTKEKPFVCDICSKAFAHRESLVTHSSVHTGIKPYLCEACGACFSCIGNLHKHRRNRPTTCGLPQYKSNAKVAPRPSFRSGRFTMKAKIPKAVMVLADDAKTTKNNSEVIEKAKSKNKRQDQSKICTNELKLDSNLENVTTSNQINQVPSECGQEKEKQINSDDKELVFLLKSNDSTFKKAETFIVKIVQENKENDDDDYGCGDLDSYMVEVSDFPDAESSKNMNSKIDIKKENDNQRIFEIEKCDVREEDDNGDFEVVSCDKNKIGKDNIETVEQIEEVKKNEDEEYEDEDNIPLSKIKLKTRLKQIENYLQEQVTKTKSTRKRKKKEEKKTLIASIDVECIKSAKHVVQNKTKKGNIIKKAPRRQRNNLSAIKADQIYECDQCPKVYYQRGPYVKHQVNDHKMNLIEVEKSLDANEPDSESLMRCKYCAKIYYQTASLKKHESLHGPKGELIHKCPCCSSYFASAQKAGKHAIQDHADTLTCNICEKIYSSPDGLNAHRKSAHKTKNELKIEKKIMNVCQKCGKKFVNKTALTDHERSDCGENPLYKCNICGKRYHSAGSLKNHQSIHTGDLPYKCSYCSKTYRTYGQVKVHERQHTGEKPYKCDICNKAFAYRESLITHSSLHTGVKRYTCHGCGMRFSCISNLQNHRRTHRDTCGILPLNSKPVAPMGIIRGVLCLGKKFEN